MVCLYYTSISPAGCRLGEEAERQKTERYKRQWVGHAYHGSGVSLLELGICCVYILHKISTSWTGTRERNWQSES